MAERIQSEIRVVHTLEGGTPTEAASSPTDVQPDELSKADTQLDELKGLPKLLGSTAVIRRITNYAIAGGERAMNNALDQKLFQESIYGDSRGMKKIQAVKTNANIVTNEVKSLSGALVTSFALKNPLLLALHLINTINKSLAHHVTRRLEVENFIEKNNLELYTNRKRQERLIIGTYNRRW